MGTIYRRTEYPGLSVNMNDWKIHHIGIVVKSVHKALDIYKLLVTKDIEFYFQDIDTQKVRVCVLCDKYGNRIEFIEPMEDKSPVSCFLKSGGGIHHLAYEVENIYVAIEQTKGIIRSLFSPVAGLDGKLFTFALVKDSAFGMNIIELIEKTNEKEKK